MPLPDSTRTTVARLLTGVLCATGIAVVATGAPAQASCSHGHSDKDSNSGYATEINVRMRSGPHTSCTINTYTGPETDGLLYHCYVVGDDIFGTNTWTWVGKAIAPSAQGWVSDYYLDDGGSYVAC